MRTYVARVTECGHLTKMVKSGDHCKCTKLFSSVAADDDHHNGDDNSGTLSHYENKWDYVII